MTINTPFGQAMEKLVQENYEARMRFVNCFLYSDGSGDVRQTPTPKKKLRDCGDYFSLE